MEKLFEKKYDLRTGDFDKFNRIKLSSILDLFQDAAGRHAEEIGIGFEGMKARSYFWVLAKTRFQILSEPALHQEVVVKTWPLEPNKIIYRREYSIESLGGEELIKGSSEWVVVDSSTRRIVSAPDLYPFSDGFITKMNFEGRLSKVEDFVCEGTPHHISPSFSLLDVNNHVNNTKYADFVLDAIKPEARLSAELVQIDYRKEVLSGTELNIYHTEKDGAVLSKGQDADGNVMFACKIIYK